MSKKQNAESEQSAEFDLKHRITGAAVLLFLGALVLPWLLGPPSEASKVELSRVQPQDSVVEPAEIIVGNDSGKTSSEISDVEETVYISKITPLDAQENNGLVDVASTRGDGAQTTQQDSSEQDSTAALQQLVREQSTEKQTDQDDVSRTQASKTAEVDSKAEEREKQQQEQAKREKALQDALAAEIESSKPKPTSSTASANRVSVGWVVQVGLFTEKNRAIALISELKNKGFNASSSVVDTNRGKNTGTRVWLGPFAKRVSAINEQKRLKSKAGKEGFIRVYP